MGDDDYEELTRERIRDYTMLFLSNGFNILFYVLIALSIANHYLGWDNGFINFFGGIQAVVYCILVCLVSAFVVGFFSFLPFFNSGAAPVAIRKALNKRRSSLFSFIFGLRFVLFFYLGGHERVAITLLVVSLTIFVSYNVARFFILNKPEPEPDEA